MRKKRNWRFLGRATGFLVAVCLFAGNMGEVMVTVAKESDVSSTLTDEERLSSTYNPIYMGSDVDYKGNPLVIGEGPNGQIGNQAFIDHQAQYLEGKSIR